MLHPLPSTNSCFLVRFKRAEMNTTPIRNVDCFDMKWVGVICAGLTIGLCTHAFGEGAASGAMVGGALGAAAGAIIGHQSRHAGEGALIGGAIGTVAGAITGHAIDSVKRGEGGQTAIVTSASLCAAVPRRTLTIHDVKAMAAAGVSDTVIIEQIKATGTRFVLTADDIIDLHQSGVSDVVIRFMIDTGRGSSTQCSGAVASAQASCCEVVVVPAVARTQVVVPPCPPPVVVCPRPVVVVRPHYHRPAVPRVIGRTHVTVGISGTWIW